MEREEDVDKEVASFNQMLAQKDFKGAEQFMLEVAERMRKKEGEASINEAKLLTSLGNLYFAQERYMDACNVARKCKFSVLPIPFYPPSLILTLFLR